MLIFIIISLISVHLICLPAASIDDRQLYLGIVLTFKNLHFSPESFSISILVISELTGYVLALSCSTSALPAPLELPPLPGTSSLPFPWDSLQGRHNPAALCTLNLTPQKSQRQQINGCANMGMCKKTHRIRVA